jgi:hypothetical protein
MHIRGVSVLIRLRACMSIQQSEVKLCAVLNNRPQYQVLQNVLISIPGAGATRRTIVLQ